MSFGGTANFDPDGPDHRSLELAAGTSVASFDDEGRLSVYFEATQQWMIQEKPDVEGPPSHISTLWVAPATHGGAAPSEKDGRGSKVPGLATRPFEYAHERDTGAFRAMYFNLYKAPASTMIGSGCGMPDSEYMWQDSHECNFKDAAVVDSFSVLRNSFASSIEGSGVQHAATSSDYPKSMHAFVSTLGCSAKYMRTNRANAHGIDWLETFVWTHQLTEYSIDVDLDTLVQFDFWNRKVVEAADCKA